MCNFLKRLADSIHRALAFEDDRAAGTTAHIDGSLGFPGDIAQDVSEGFLQLAAGLHLGWGESKLLHVLAGK